MMYILTRSGANYNYKDKKSLNKWEVKTMFGKNSKMNRPAKSAKSSRRNVEGANEAKSSSSRSSSEAKNCK